MTLEEIRKEARHVRNRIRCIITDRDRDVRRSYEEHWRIIGPMLDDLSRLRERRYRGSEMIAELEALIARKEKELMAAMNAPKIKKIIDLIRLLNGTSKKKKKDHNARRILSRLTNERVTTLRMIISGLKSEVTSIHRLSSGDRFAKKEAELTTAIAAQCKYFARFLDNRVNGDELLDAAYEELEVLRRAESKAGGEAKVAKMGEKMDELLALMAQMSPEAIRAAMSRIS